MTENPNQDGIFKVNITPDQYNPPEITIDENVVLEFTNLDNEEHSVTSYSDGLDVEIEPGQTRRIMFMLPGEYEIYDRFHPKNRGLIVVEENRSGSVKRS